jgi:hypothetical protein
MQPGAPAPQKDGTQPSLRTYCPSYLLSAGICAVTLSDATSQVILILLSLYDQYVFPKWVQVQSISREISGPCCHAIPGAICSLRSSVTAQRPPRRRQVSQVSSGADWYFKSMQPAPRRSIKQTTANSEHIIINIIASLNMFILSLRWMGNLGHFGRNPFANTEIDLQSNKATSSKHNKPSLQCRSDIETNPTVTWNWFLISLYINIYINI